jgi:pimeloyl-ACP methyl ester carboxylesterase
MGDIILQFIFFVLALLILPLSIYLIYCLRYYIKQTRWLYLRNYPFIARKRNLHIPYREISYTTSDNKTISALYVPAGDVRKDEPVILFCHGNVGTIFQRIDTFHIFRQLGFGTFIFDYRGYGKSSGKPSEKGTYLDAEGAWKYLTQEMKISPQNIIIFGRSLGGGIASYIAEKYKPRAVVIESSFTSVLDIAIWSFPWVPTKQLTKFEYNTLQRLKSFDCPLLIIHSPDDEVIPFVHGKWLYRNAKEPKQFLKIKGRHYYGFLDSGNLYKNGLKHFFVQHQIIPGE